jgi:hypothetical protein
VRAITDPKGFVEKQFTDYKGSNAGKGLALRCGLLNLQVAALQVAACNANMKVRAPPRPPGHQASVAHTLRRRRRFALAGSNGPPSTCRAVGALV